MCQMIEHGFPWFLGDIFDKGFQEWSEKHVSECREARDALKNILTDSLTYDKKRIIRGMVRDLKMVIDWLAKRDEPKGKTDWSRESKWKRTIPVDPTTLKRMAEHGKVGKVTTLWDTYEEQDYWESYLVDQFLAMLTDQQREVFEMKYLGCLTDRQIAEYLGTSRGNVRNILKAIDKKRRKFLAEFENGLIL